MLLRVAVFAMMSLGLGGFGVVAMLALRENAPPVATAASEPPPLRRVVLAASGPLRAGVLLKPEDLASTQLADIPAGAQDDMPATRAALVGAMLRRSLAANEALVTADVMRPGDHGFLAAVMSPGKRAATVAVDAVSGSAGLIWPGDRVDLILTQALDATGLPAAHRVAAETVLADVRVVAIDQLLAHGVAPMTEAAGASRTVTLEVSPAEAERIAVATRLGRLSLAVRAAEPVAEAPAEPAQVSTTWGGDVSPALGGPAPARPDGPSLRLYEGNADVKEIRF